MKDPRSLVKSAHTSSPDVLCVGIPLAFPCIRSTNCRDVFISKERHVNYGFRTFPMSCKISYMNIKYPHNMRFDIMSIIIDNAIVYTNVHFISRISQCCPSCNEKCWSNHCMFGALPYDYLA